MILREYEKSAIFSILVRQIEAQEIKAAAEKEAAIANERIATAQATMNNVRPALSVFGFDTTSNKLWDAVKEAIGPEMYYHAFNVAKGEEEKKTASEQTAEKSDPAESPIESSKDESAMTVDEAETPKIKEIVTERLRQAGNAGAKATEIKDFVSAQGIAMHEKTIGMTLNRLSKAGRAHRVGRTWFYIASDGDSNKIDPAEENAANGPSAGSAL